MGQVHRCCYMFAEFEGFHCSKEAKWEILPNGSLYKETHSCNEHLSDLLDSDTANAVYYIGEIKDGKEDTEDQDSVHKHTA